MTIAHTRSAAIAGAITDVTRARAMVVGGALGDALGNPIEFLSIDQIRARYGPDGITTPVTGASGSMEITDDTQMTLFTLEGLIRAHHHLRTTHTDAAAHDGSDSAVITGVHAAYLRWLHTQGEPVPTARLTGWLITHPELHAVRAPGHTCLTALRATATPDTAVGTIRHRLNTSKGCGAVMRAAPCALWPADRATVFRLGVHTAALTHSHPTGYLAAGTLAVLIRELLHDHSLTTALRTACVVLRTWPEHEELLDRLRAATRLARPRRRPRRPTPEALAAELGGGWTAEDALAIACCAALCATDFTDGLQLAANHSGDSDSTAAITGNILGAHLGTPALPASWRQQLELAPVIDQIATDAITEFTHPAAVAADWQHRYPPD